MKEKNKRCWWMWVVVALVFAVYAATMLVVRLNNQIHLQKTVYQQWKQDYLVTRGQATFVNAGTTKHPAGLSEAQGYGMMITAVAGQRGWASQKEFDRLLNYYLNERDVVDNKQTALMKWRQYQKDGQWVSDANSATDGDLYIADSLALAAKTWPKRAAYYHRLEKALANDILAYEYNPTTKVLTTGDWVDAKSRYYKLMRTSDVMPTVFDQLAKDTGNQQWASVKSQMLDRLVDLSNQHKTGLVPDFAWVTAKSAKPVGANTIASKYDGDYWFNACRVPYLLATSKDPRAKKVLNKMMKFFAKQYEVFSGYTLKGKLILKRKNAGFSAPIFYAVNHNRNQGYDNLFNSEKSIYAQRLNQNDYYGATLTTLVAVEGWK